ncbi:Glutamyl-tRNA(Gln) amidotransferase asparaginase subunit [Candidatus Methanomethylophilus alvi Mx1201]|jgi:glutamyl-tRNA(Gln) amidotransferase subunit D|uniref:Glutamyl-tRNA(Gln) amidotransferase subunit D n=2 Tax=Methanomethylophilus alvi TaxID=1291540 RepID=M9SJW8_METAX|nr:Glu-tRNA(Gln) amidotransferase subunit GatD [Methanomethylophilus alvi]AGI86348.1 Glutamyl-tRNA(Gln) amidotransferase asparaginase subunit [Candidatus Methanomethylophilus alvi Mx1201]AYQ55713.1 glutamyl-tRNA(Gln) amidotransferase subunit D [Methanomethylophilus alvi]MCI5973430.1 Glu-tRNA(Gln) amidotransferase subunit GatD [Methanomethylophilus alvi]MDD7479723.1 Glu-tRNA(Gln) amidotransferase subunit GatD [Methanomethylophilus alvi]
MYAEFLSKKLGDAGAEEGCTLSIETSGKSYKGVLMPHHEFSGEDIVILKVKSGYNIGIRIDESAEIEVVSKPVERVKPESAEETKEGLKTIVLIGTGGTIASYVDYRTGAVHPALSTSDMINAVPEIKEVANLKAKVLFSIFSENMTVPHWQKLAEAIAEELDGGADAVIVPHGTDTMGYTASAVSFMLGEVSKPVVFVGAQRSSDRPSSDASCNLMAAAKFCVEGGRAGVFVVMHDGPGDDSFAVHCGTRVRKMHTSRRDAFKSINVPPVAHVDKDGKIVFNTPGRAVSDAKVEARSAMCTDVVLLQFYPGMDPALFHDVVMKSKGVVIAGSGLGHVNSNMVPLIKEATDAGIIVVVTSQCLNGRTNLNVYNTGRDMLAAGAITVWDMLPETAYTKLMWALANTSSVEAAKVVMQTPLAGEMSDRRELL